jgi:hypothetical protein
MRITASVTLLLVLTSGSAFALEAVTTGSQATQATVGAINSKVDTTNNFINAIMKCNALRKFYAPSDAKKDANGCVGVGDYTLPMIAGSDITLADGSVNAVGDIAAVHAKVSGNGNAVIGDATANIGGIGGSFSGGNSGVRASGTAYGLLANATTGYAVYGSSANNIGGYFSGTYGTYGQGSLYGMYGSASAASGGVGVRGDGASDGWGGYFTGGVNITGKLCLNGGCVNSLSSGGTAYSSIENRTGVVWGSNDDPNRPLLIMMSGGKCGNNTMDLQGYVGSTRVAYADDTGNSGGKDGSIAFIVPPGTGYHVFSNPSGCSPANNGSYMLATFRL